MLGPETSFLCRIESPESIQFDSVASVLEKVVSGRRFFISWGLAFDRLCNMRTEVRVCGYQADVEEVIALVASGVYRGVPRKGRHVSTSVFAVLILRHSRALGQPSRNMGRELGGLMNHEHCLHYIIHIVC